jgi:hypothetical protein
VKVKELPKGLKVTITAGSLIALGSVMVAFNPFACLCRACFVFRRNYGHL